MLNFPKIEKKILKFWEDKKIFEKSLKKNKKGERFVFFEGPPTANGLPGIHHVLARAFKDVIPRYKTMQGFFVERKAGWDTHGLPVELEVEKELNISGKGEIEKLGVGQFNDKCKSSVWKYKKDWEQMTKRLGFWVDLENPYVTYDNDYIESVWWILKQVWDKKLLYKGYKVVPQCPRCGTTLSTHEVAQGYQNIEEDSVYIKFELVDEPSTFVLAWTTTPWTLPGNVALAVGKDIEYEKIQIGNGEKYIIARDRRSEVINLPFSNTGINILWTGKGKDLIGKRYKPLFDFLDLGKETDKKAYYIADADFVNLEEGTGVVHTAVMYGEDDYDLGEKIGLPKIHTVDENGKFNDLVKPWQGRFVKGKKLEQEIIQYLKDKNLLFKTEKYKHDYPFCWRCDSPLLYYAKDSWFIKMSALRNELKKNNEKINWVPSYIKEGRFGEWINEVKDWAISRERYWGTPLPIWQCEKCEKYECVGSREELEGYKGDLHRPHVDDIKLKCQCGGEMTRVPEVIDCWFDSGAMPFAQWHYPFENKERIDKNISFPADFISEAIDQTRGWFYTLLAISTLLGKGPSYKNVICLGLVMDNKGKKMSKSKGNIIKPDEIFEKYGADVARWYFYTMNQSGETKLFDMKGVEEVIKKVFNTLMNVVTFYKMYEEDKIKEIKSEQVLDKWILLKLNNLVREVTNDLDNYQLTNASRKISAFVSDLSTWYLRRSRSRFKGDDKDDKEKALATLRKSLFTLSQIMAPFTPFLAEEIYLNLQGNQKSVHLEDWPKFEKMKEGALMDDMALVRQIVEIGHALRAENGIKVRQPLSQLVVKAKSLDDQYLEILKDELNVKEVQVGKDKKAAGSEFKTKEEGEIIVSLDLTITDELKEQGMVREAVRQINDLRKKAGLTIKDRVKILYFSEDKLIKGMFKRYEKNIENDTLADSINFVKKNEVDEIKSSKEFDLEKKKIKVGFKE